MYLGREPRPLADFPAPGGALDLPLISLSIHSSLHSLLFPHLPRVAGRLAAGGVYEVSSAVIRSYRSLSHPRRPDAGLAGLEPVETASPQEDGNGTAVTPVCRSLLPVVAVAPVHHRYNMPRTRSCLASQNPRSSGS